MVRRTRPDAVSAVTGDLFERDWSRVRGSMQGLAQSKRRGQMARAAGGGRAAVFKAIRTGGCHTRAQLANQLDYLTTKSSHVVDSRGVLDGKTTLTSDEIDAVADRFARRWSDGFHPKLGQTTHMLMSFPVGTKGEDVRDIASDVCARFFANEARHFDYLVAVHEDRDHPHAHVVLNRKSQEGEFFYLGRDHHFNYDDFRIAMVEAAETHGVRLEATRRIDRGVLTYAPRTDEIYAARDAGRVPVGRERVGRDLTAAQAAVQAAARVYHRLGRAETRADKVGELVRAGEILAGGGQLEPWGGIYAEREPREGSATEDRSAGVSRPKPEGSASERVGPSAKPQTFDEAKAAFLAGRERVAALIAERPAAERPALQARMDAILAASARAFASEARPVGDGGACEELTTGTSQGALDLGEPPRRASGATVSDPGPRPADTLHPDRAAEDVVDEGDPEGASKGDSEDHYDFHFDAGAVEERARAIGKVLRDGGASEAQVADRAEDILDQAYDGIDQEQRAWLAGRGDVLAMPSAVYGANADGTVTIVDPALAARIEDMALRMTRLAEALDDVAGAVTAAFRAMYTRRPGEADIPDHLARGLGATYETVCRLRAAEREGHVLRYDGAAAGDVDPVSGAISPDWEGDRARPHIDRVVARERLETGGYVQVEYPDTAAFRREVEAALGPERLAALRAGDADALDGVLGDRMDRLHAAKAYLQSDSDPAVADGAGLNGIIGEIAHRDRAETDARRLKDGLVESRGLRH